MMIGFSAACVLKNYAEASGGKKWRRSCAALDAKVKTRKWRDLSPCPLAVPVQMTAFWKFPSLPTTVSWWQWRKSNLWLLSEAWSAGSAALGWETAVVLQMQAGIGGARGRSQASCSSSRGSMSSLGAYFAAGCISASCVITLSDTWTAQRCVLIAGRQNLWRLRETGKENPKLSWNAELHLTVCFILQVALSAYHLYFLINSLLQSVLCHHSAARLIWQTCQRVTSFFPAPLGLF